MKKKDKKELAKKEEEKEKDLEDISKLFEDIVNGDKTEENLEEFISGLDSKIKKKNNNNAVAYIFGILVHRNIFIHLLITLVLNYALIFAMQGFFKLVIYEHLYTLAIAVLIFTVAEFIVKVLFVRFFLRLILSTMGLIFVVLQILYFELMYYFLPDFNFESQVNLIVFVLMFALFRYIITRVAHRYVASLKKGD
ncbi:MAG: phage holin family protein [bacterium]|nr:phage holin family protein [bacterium]